MYLRDIESKEKNYEESYFGHRPRSGIEKYLSYCIRCEGKSHSLFKALGAEAPRAFLFCHQASHYKYHHITKGLYATFSSWHIDACRFTMRYSKSHCIKDLCHTLFLFSSKRLHITYLLEISNPNSFPKRYYQTLS